MIKAISITLLLISTQIFSQTNTEVFLCDLMPEYGGLNIYSVKNISNDPGYDSQPSFPDDNTVFFAGNNKGQTDIAKYVISNGIKSWYNVPTDGGEYSPTLIPNNTKVAAVRLDTNGLQRLYAYGDSTNDITELSIDLQVAYFAFFNDRKILASVLSDDRLDLVISEINSTKVDTLLTNSGRSIHKVPGSKSMSYTLQNQEKNQDLYLLDMANLESFFVCQLPIGIQDYVWLNDSQVLIGSGSRLYIYDTFLNSEWKEIADLTDYNIKDISRLAVSPNGKRLAIVAEPN